MLKKLFGSKKQEYFVEIGDGEGASNGKTSAKPAEKAPEPKADKAQPQAKAPEAKAQPPAKAPEAKAQPKAEAPKAQTPAATPKPATPGPKAPKREAFATQYLVPKSTTPRRRPGANMKSFLDMAKDPNMKR